MNQRGPRYPVEEFVRRGEELYERLIKPEYEPQENGKFVAIDIETGEYEIDEGDLDGALRLHARIPGAQPWLTRIGYGYGRKIGGSNTKRGIDQSR